MALLEAEKHKKAFERENLRKELFQEEALKKKHRFLKQQLERKLRKSIPRITEINLIAKELQREISLSVKLEYHYSPEEKPRIYVEITNSEEKSIYNWSLGKFRNRYYLIKDLFDRFLL